ncbi:HPP family protein [Paenibacillus alvei]|uniref:HPP family protein n=1 Tax=Paenibacillus alvei TaxID=44250 RepID=A0ABT4GT96_PAEAL|nr:HPP family protein [Paenibacillus alvei]EJW17944.1 HPP family protein [Paenibacillus alvei DSM 29]MCY9543864.1 HPP family protein [Paenibacillus alvei]MCY9703449.1 HPP family protein [Paenibacillus alvei]MCY9732331.1 HPP family protein [Paenibacillus alvei]MCY9754612.1 HPP family protein [Paenibacillus alvei]
MDQSTVKQTSNRSDYNRNYFMNIKMYFTAGIGGALAILLLAVLEKWSNWPYLMAPFGASCVILFALPDSPLAQPRNVVGGHLISSLVGFIIGSSCGVHPWSLALAIGLAIILMQWTHTVHPPAGADPLLMMMTGASWSFLLLPVGIGAVILVLAAWAYHRARGFHYPKRWL